jgi:hypothetical protein
MPPRLNPARDRLPAALRPVPISVTLPAVQLVDQAERELRRHAQADANRCWGFFPALTGRPGIHVALPACRDFADAMPEVAGAAAPYRFNFIRLALGGSNGQAAARAQPSYHLDSDAATALTGDPATMDQRDVGRVLLNLSPTRERTLHYLDLDVYATALVHEGAYVHPADPTAPAGYEARVTVAPRSGRVVHGIRFLANRVLHSGVDGPYGHFVAAYGYDIRIQRPLKPSL